MQQRFYCRSYCLLNTFRAPLCPSSGAQEYYTVVAACGILCCKNVKIIYLSFCRIWVLSLKCPVLSRFVTRCVECRWGCVSVCVIVWLWTWWIVACIWSEEVHTCGFSSSWSGVELRVMRPVCRMLVYWLCFVACMVWVTEGQLKKRVRVI